MGCGKPYPRHVRMLPVDHIRPITATKSSLFRANARGGMGEEVDGTFYTDDTRLFCRFVLSHITYGLSARVRFQRNRYKCCANKTRLQQKTQEPPNREILTCSIPSLMVSVIDTHAELPREWPVGDYDVQLFINGRLIQTVAFQIVPSPYG
ncbi:uncharacterized protein MONOS_6846 [Monocercomonoides exilis]|uniref:uncharacterized protein n=1 Tax=Monocercomonoides exilis TaxID=2049356 RepID=UPI00355AA1FF|nr:hypothetical protein MONOS_6846 [Monocercomonoides exilis]|eukprot:MONOS_6846.1-p1 / transcript=MONOS_6846.1 / gene=MONOS_6846 / organism=Monocercomonoides_exilis_PA203 / gene_product=unspecified product / transcript_product=unspecified product / location=Mono_scaffold00223:70322-71179(+) / protein_length=151 / sequence_SO=supercontig / SO=protein_coding / is_pseudo=false